jgi:hypothetical protein
MAYSNCKLNVRSLVAKLAIDERPGFSYVDGRTYIIYEPGEIIDRRIAAGLTHVIRTRGVAFVNPVSGAPICSPHNLGAIKSGAPVNAESGALGVGGRLESWHLTTKQDEKLPAAPTAIVTALRRHVPDVDSEAASDLWRRCLEQAPEATVAEAVHFIDLKAGKPDIRMPLGFLLAAVPKCFQGDFYREFREQRARGREEAVSNRIFAQEVLRNPASDEEQRQWAREILGIRSEGPR